jgi:diacylglycerol kinase family enzyme
MSEKHSSAWVPQSCTDPACWYIIANPAARRGAMGRAWPDIARIFQSLNIPFTIRFTEYRGHAILLAEEAVLAGAGKDNGHWRRRYQSRDGARTVHAAAPSPAEITYALLPFGTGNDWARQYRAAL